MVEFEEAKTLEETNTQNIDDLKLKIEENNKQIEDNNFSLANVKIENDLRQKYPKTVKPNFEFETTDEWAELNKVKWQREYEEFIEKLKESNLRMEIQNKSVQEEIDAMEK